MLRSSFASAAVGDSLELRNETLVSLAPDPDDPLEAQQSLVESSLPLVFQTYDEALAEGQTQPIVVLLDCEDELGGEIARGWLGEEAVNDAVAMRHADDASADTTVFARAAPLAACRGELAEAFPYLAPALVSAPDDGVLVIGVTAGGASALTAPFGAR